MSREYFAAMNLRLVAIVLITLVTAGCGDIASSVAAAQGGSKKVVYEVSGAKRAGNVTYSADGGGGIAQENGIALPWRKEVEFNGSFKVGQLTAQNEGDGTITCRISVDGKVVKELSSQGPYAVVACTTEAF